MEKRLITAAETAEILGIGRTKVYELMGNGKLASVHIGTRRLIIVSRLDEYVAELAQSGDSAA